MREKPDGFLMPKVQPTTGQPEQDDPAVTFHEGRAYRHEGSQRDPDYGVTRTDMEALRQRHVERAMLEKRISEAQFQHALANAAKLTGKLD